MLAKSISSAAIVLLMACSAEHPDSSQSHRTDLDNAALQGPVDTVVTELRGESGEIGGDGPLVTLAVVYNRAGDLLGVKLDTSRLEEDSRMSAEIKDTERGGAGFYLFGSEQLHKHYRSMYSFDPDRPYWYAEAVTDTTGKLVSTYSHNNSPDGRFLSWRRVDGESNLATVDTTRFDTHGRYTEQIRYEDDGALLHHWTYRYNEDGLLIAMASHDIDGNIRLQYDFDYEYDRWGNWIKRTKRVFRSIDIIEGNIAVSEITRRKITYYNGAR